MRHTKAILHLMLIFALLSFAACSNNNHSDENNQPIKDTANMENISADKPIVDLPIPDATEAIEPPFEGKIAIITDDFIFNNSYSAFLLVEKYSKDKFVHAVWPINDLDFPETTLLKLASDQEIRAIIMYQPFTIPFNY